MAAGHNTKTRRFAAVLGRLAGVLALSAALAACSPEKQAKTQNAVLPNEFGAAATQMGVKACAPLFSVLGQTLTANSEFSAKLIPDKKQADAHGLTAIVGQFYQGAAAAKGAGTVYAAPVSGGCEGVLVRTLLMPQACGAVAAQHLPKGTQRQDNLAQTAVFAMPEGGYVMMMPATADSCVVVMTLSLQQP